MSLPAPDLDNLKFQDIVDAVKVQIAQRCPEWTDHNVSDPGVTLIELFSWMTEQMIYRLNQVPERNYIKFLDMLGISLNPPTPATVELRFLLSRYIRDKSVDESLGDTLPKWKTVAATMRTATDEAIEFSLDDDVTYVRPELMYVLAKPAKPYDFLADQRTEVRTFDYLGQAAVDEAVSVNSLATTPFEIYSSAPEEGDALYFGFSPDRDISGNLIQLEVNCVRSAATGLDEDYPAQIWEYLLPTDDQWEPLRLHDDLPDTTYGFNRSPGDMVNGNKTGLIRLPLPQKMTPSKIADKDAYWIRCRYTVNTIDLPPRGPRQLRPRPYLASPSISGIKVQVIGAMGKASQRITIGLDKPYELGVSTGLAEQAFKIPDTALPLRAGETVLVRDPRDAQAEWEKWTPVADFIESKPEDLHFVYDLTRKEAIFGPTLTEKSGRAIQHGKIPLRGNVIYLSSFSIGGGTKGNVGSGKITVLKTSNAYILNVNNPWRAEGGLEAETLEQAKARSRQILRLHERGVTGEDFEDLAKTRPGVARAHCVGPFDESGQLRWAVTPHLTPTPHAFQASGAPRAKWPASTLNIYLVPELRADIDVPTPKDLETSLETLQDVQTFLDDRRVITTQVAVLNPIYVFVLCDVTAVQVYTADPATVRAAIAASLKRYLHPLQGGPAAKGYPFGRPLRLGEIFALVQSVPGVKFVTEVKLSYVKSDLSNTFLGPEVPANRDGIIQPEVNELICSHTQPHRITLKPESMGL